MAATSAPSAQAWRGRDFVERWRAVLPYEQAKRFAKLYEDEFYLITTRFGDVELPQDVRLEFAISGSTRNVYTVRAHADGSMTCTCPDAYMHCVRKGCVCKHVCFVLARVLRQLDLSFFSGEPRHRLTPAQLEAACDTCVNVPVDDEVAAATLVRRLDEETQAQARNRSSNMRPAASGATASIRFDEYRQPGPEDDCPVCYDSLLLLPQQQRQDDLVGCPDCHNAVHKKCMQKWVSVANRRTCVYCRSTKWAAWGGGRR